MEEEAGREDCNQRQGRGGKNEGNEGESKEGSG